MTEEHNPFASPRSEVAAGEANILLERPVRRPTAVNIALFLIGIGIALAVVAVLRTPSPQLADREQLVALAFGVLSVLVYSLLFYFILRGRNWARIVYLVLTVISLAEVGAWLYVWYFFESKILEQVASRPSLSTFAWIFFPRLLAVSAVILLFGPGRAWFRKRAVPN
jgi:hypothetical protein